MGGGIDFGQLISDAEGVVSDVTGGDSSSAGADALQGLQDLLGVTGAGDLKTALSAVPGVLTILGFAGAEITTYVAAGALALGGDNQALTAVNNFNGQLLTNPAAVIKASTDALSGNPAGAEALFAGCASAAAKTSPQAAGGSNVTLNTSGETGTANTRQTGVTKNALASSSSGSQKVTLSQKQSGPTQKSDVVTSSSEESTAVAGSSRVGLASPPQREAGPIRKAVAPPPASGGGIWMAAGLAGLLWWVLFR